MNRYVAKPCITDLEYVAQHMRPEDIEECAAGGKEPFAALSEGWFAGKSWVLLTPDETPAAILGVHKTDTPGYGMVWMLGTPAIEQHPITFLRHSKPVLDELFSEYALLYNYTYYKNEVHHKWLRWLGFTLSERQGDWIPFHKWRS